MAETTSRDTRVILKNVRSFVGAHSVRLAPLTILVGENSAGKSTLLAVLASILSRGFPLKPAFGKRPFELGGFSTIVTRNRSASKQADAFEIGLTEGAKGSPAYSEFVATYVGVKDRPTISKLAISNPTGSVVLTRHGKSLGADVRLSSTPPQQFDFSLTPDLLEGDISSALVQSYVSDRVRRKDSAPSSGEFEHIFKVTTQLDFLRRTMRAVAPIRTKPRRIYDGLLDEFSPEGDHIPPLLARAIADVDGDRDDSLRAMLALFGKRSGMFRNVDVKTLGHEPRAPFQLRARMAGVTANLTDVGYGVSQVLPILVECLTMPLQGGVLALQQPEVHLHPRAQAELGSLCADVATAHPKSTLIVETHSDYLLNRVRRKVADKTLAPKDVSLVFFERRNASTKVHQLDLDRLGNITTAPPAYREFFLREELDLLSRGGA